MEAGSEHAAQWRGRQRTHVPHTADPPVLQRPPRLQNTHLDDVMQAHVPQGARHIRQGACEVVLPRPLVRNLALELCQQVLVFQQLCAAGSREDFKRGARDCARA